MMMGGDRTRLHGCCKFPGGNLWQNVYKNLSVSSISPKTNIDELHADKMEKTTPTQLYITFNQ